MFRRTSSGSSGSSSSSSSSHRGGDQSHIEFQNVFIHPNILNGDFDKIPTSDSPSIIRSNIGNSEFKMVNVVMGNLSLKFTKPKSTSPPLDSIILTWTPRSETKKVPISKEMLAEKAHPNYSPGELQLTSKTKYPQLHGAVGMDLPHMDAASLKKLKDNKSLASEIKHPSKDKGFRPPSVSSIHKTGPSFVSVLRRSFSGLPLTALPEQLPQAPKEKPQTQEDIEVEIISSGFTINFKDIFGLHRGINSGQYGGKIWIVKNTYGHTVLPPLYFLEKYTFTSFWDTLHEYMECKSDPKLPNVYHFSVLQDKFLISKSFFKLRGSASQIRGGTRKENPMNEDEFMTLFDSEGRINVKSQEFFANKAYFNGFKNTIRAEAWKFLLGFYPFESTFQERADIYVHRQHNYNLLKNDWKAYLEKGDPNDPFSSKFKADRYQIEKDAKRTDREDPFFGPDSQVRKLHDVLVTYDFFNRDLSYVQGMNFICAIIMKVMDGDEVFTFWCFKKVMNKCRASYCKNQIDMKTQLQALSDILKIVDIELYTHLEKARATEMFICYRWILVLFRMEFSADTTIEIWESLFSGYLKTTRPELFFSLAIIVHVRDELLSRPYTFDELLAFFNSYNTRDRVPCTTLITLAEKLYKKFMQSKPRQDLLSYVHSMSAVV